MIASTHSPLSESATLTPSALPRPADVDAALVRRLQSGDRSAFREIVARHQARLFRVALRFTRDETLAQDALQDAFLQAFRKIDQFESQSALSTWLHRVTVNAALMRLRSQKRHHEIPLEETSPRYTDGGELAEPVDDWSTAVDDGVIQSELALHAARAVDELPEGYRSIFILRELEDLSTEEVADILDLSISAVKTRLHRARLSLRKTLAKRVKELA
jgi:RNA polymerase sigma-70 factor (ECF subfamily)